MGAFESLTIEISEHVATVTLVGPGRGNAMGPDFWRELPVAMAELDADPAVRVVLLKGKGKTFSTGLDLVGMMGELGPLLQGPQLAKGRLALRRLIRSMQDAISSVERCSKPVIAAIQGWCIGGGIDLVTACDIRLCSADARFSVREVKLAIVADVGTLQRLHRIVGQGIAREWVLRGNDFDAVEAERTGLVNRICGDGAALDAAATAMAAEIAANPPLTVQGAKHVMNWAADHGVQEGLDYVATWNASQLQSEDMMEAMAAFMERRDPVFKGQ